jgi:integrase/recombinase XerD
MNYGSSGLLASKGLFGFMQYKTAEGLSPATLVTYEQILKVWISRIGEKLIDRITPDDLRNYLAWLRTEYKPRRFSGSDYPYRPKACATSSSRSAPFLHRQAKNSDSKIL